MLKRHETATQQGAASNYLQCKYLQACKRAVAGYGGVPKPAPEASECKYLNLSHHMAKQARFDFDAQVRIVSQKPTKKKVWGEIGKVAGKAQNDDGEWSYAIWIYRDRRCWSMNEDELDAEPAPEASE